MYHTLIDMVYTFMFCTIIFFALIRMIIIHILFNTHWCDLLKRPWKKNPVNFLKLKYLFICWYLMLLSQWAARLDCAQWTVDQLTDGGPHGYKNISQNSKQKIFWYEYGFKQCIVFPDYYQTKLLVVRIYLTFHDTKHFGCVWYLILLYCYSLDVR